MAMEIAAILKQLDDLKAQYRMNVIETVQAIMAEHNITPDDLSIRKKAKPKAAPAEAPAKRKYTKRATKKASPMKGRSMNLTPQFQDPTSGATWSGHGRAPAWIANAKDREKFRIAA